MQNMEEIIKPKVSLLTSQNLKFYMGSGDCERESVRKVSRVSKTIEMPKSRLSCSGSLSQVSFCSNDDNDSILSEGSDSFDHDAFECVADQRVFKMEQSVFSIYKQRQWIEKALGCKNVEYRNNKLRWTEYFAHSVLHDRKVSVVVRFTKLTKCQLNKITLCCSSNLTIHDVVKKAIHKYKTLMKLDIAHSDCCVLQVTGYSEYMVNYEKTLQDYRYIRNAVRRSEQADLTLIRLNEQELRSCRHRTELDQKHPTADFLSNEKALLDAMPKHTDIRNLHVPLRIRLHSVEHIVQHEDCNVVYVKFALRIGEKLLSLKCDATVVDPKAEYMSYNSTAEPLSDSVVWDDEWVQTGYHWSRLPSYTVLECTVIGVNESKQYKILAAVKVPLVDHNFRCIEGTYEFRLRGMSSIAAAFGMVVDQSSHPGLLPSGFPHGENLDSNAGILKLEFDTYEDPVICSDMCQIPENYSLNSSSSKEAYFSPQLPSQEENDVPSTIVADLHRIAHQDSLVSLSIQDCSHLWKYRSYCTRYPKLLPNFLRATNWSSIKGAAQARSLLFQWQEFKDPAEALELLFATHADPVVRWYAVCIINKMKDVELAQYLLQLVQALKHEIYHDSPLSRFLLFRCLQNPNVLGHPLFWLLRVEAHIPEYAERYSVLLAIYCTLCGQHWYELRTQLHLIDKLELIGRLLKSTPKEQRLEVARSELQILGSTLPNEFHICLCPRFKVKSFVINQCKVMDSKKHPMWLCFENADAEGEKIYAIFKYGDDLRQDLVTLQVLNKMDELWLQNNLDLKMNPYTCQIVGPKIGMIEVITNARTTAQIHYDYGNTLFGALMDAPIEKYLKESSQGNNIAYERSVDTFIRSCAGYCVATFVMGIGDRHSDNIMVAGSGHFFHIDFGHFLGNFKHFATIKRERAPMVFTPEMAFVMGRRHDTRYREFQSMSCKAFNILRQNCPIFILLFRMMVPARMEELFQDTDIIYIRDQLSLELSDTEATLKIKQVIKRAVSSNSRRIDNLIHNITHGADIF